MHTIETAVKQLGLPVKMKPLDTISPQVWVSQCALKSPLIPKYSVYYQIYFFFYVVVLNYLKPVHIESKSTL